VGTKRPGTIQKVRVASGAPGADIAVDLMESLHSRERVAGEDRFSVMYLPWKEPKGG